MRQSIASVRLAKCVDEQTVYRVFTGRNGEDPCRDPLRADAAGRAIEFVEVRDTSSEALTSRP